MGTLWVALGLAVGVSLTPADQEVLLQLLQGVRQREAQLVALSGTMVRHEHRTPADHELVAAIWRQVADERSLPPPPVPTVGTDDVIAVRFAIAADRLRYETLQLAAGGLPSDGGNGLAGQPQGTTWLDGERRTALDRNQLSARVEPQDRHFSPASAPTIGDALLLANGNRTWGDFLARRLTLAGLPVPGAADLDPPTGTVTALELLPPTTIDGRPATGVRIAYASPAGLAGEQSLWFAASLCYAVVRYESSLSAGAVERNQGTSAEAMRFTEVSPGLWLPSMTKTTTWRYSAANAQLPLTISVHRFQDLAVDPVEATVFTADLPLGTTVHDAIEATTSNVGGVDDTLYYELLDLDRPHVAEPAA